jgi:large subunit ribosomal protein L31
MSAEAKATKKPEEKAEKKQGKPEAQGQPKAAAEKAPSEKAPRKTEGKSKAVAVDAKGKIQYHKVTISCACGATYEAGSTLPAIRVDICANCHPFYTGENKIIDAEGRVEKFKKKYALKKQAA